MKKNTSLALIWKYISHKKLQILWLTFFYIGSIILLTLMPRAMSHFVNTAYHSADISRILIPIMLYLAAACSYTVLAGVLNYQLTVVGQQITDDYRNDVLAHYLSLDLKYFSNLAAGETMTRLDEDVKGLFQYYYILFYKLAGSGITLLIILFHLFFETGWLTVLLLFASVFSILGFKIIQDRGVKKYVRKAKAAAAFNGTMKELLDNAHVLRALNAATFAGKRLRSAMIKCFRKSLPANLMYANLWSAATVMESLILGSGLLLALFFWDRNLITLGTAFLIYTYCDLIISPLQDFRNHMGDIQSSKAGLVRTQSLLKLESSSQKGTRQLDAGAVSVTIEDVHYAYQKDRAILHGISLQVAAGRKIGLIGESGCGKSTLISLIARLNTLEQGQIHLNGIPLPEIAADNLRQHMAYCTQHVQLFHGSLRDNITLFSDAYTDPQISLAISRIGLSDWLKQFPDGLNTWLDLGEDSISAGEAQLVALIRLALKRPGLILLDELTANLDSETEQRINEVLRALCAECTVISIAHRMSSLEWMDEIVTMEYGRIIHAGKGVS